MQGLFSPIQQGMFYLSFIMDFKRRRKKNAKVSQMELAQRTQTTKSYISRIENGLIIPSVAVFYKMIGALGLRIEIVRSVYLNEPGGQYRAKSKK